MNRVLFFLESVSLGYEAVTLIASIDHEFLAGLGLSLSIMMLLFMVVEALPNPSPPRRTRRGRRQVMRQLLIRELAT